MPQSVCRDSLGGWTRPDVKGFWSVCRSAMRLLRRLRRLLRPRSSARSGAALQVRPPFSQHEWQATEQAVNPVAHQCEDPVSMWRRCCTALCCEIQILQAKACHTDSVHSIEDVKTRSLLGCDPHECA